MWKKKLIDRVRLSNSLLPVTRRASMFLSLSSFTLYILLLSRAESNITRSIRNFSMCFCSRRYVAH